MKIFGHLVAMAMVVSVNAESPPNIVIFLADDLGWDDVSFHGSRQIPTPNIDALAYDGIMFDNYYVQPICSPSRAALLTARYPIHLGLQNGVINACRRYGLGLNETILPQYLKELGYATHGLGKWHLGFYTEDYIPSNRGFDSYFGMYAGTGDYWTHCYNHAENGTWDGYGLDLHYNNELVNDQFGVYGTHLFSSSAVDLIDKHDTTKPMFLYFAEQAVHAADVVKLEAPYEYVQRFDHIVDKQRRSYAGMVSVLDESVGNVTRALHRRGMLNNTIIVFSTDNGGPVNTAAPNHASNQPLRGEKSTLWEGGVRGVSFVWSPLLGQSKHVSHHLMHITDWLPTLLHAAGYNMASLKTKPLDGFDMWPTLLYDSPSKREDILLNIDPIGDLAAAVRWGNYKLMVHGSNGTAQWFPTPRLSNPSQDLYYQQTPHDFPDVAPDYMFHSDLEEILKSLGRGSTDIQQHPLVVKCGTKPANASWNCDLKVAPCLYDIIEDPCEYNNLAGQRPDLVSVLMKRLERYRTSMVPMKNKPVDPAGLPVNNDWAYKPWVKREDDIAETRTKLENEISHT